MPVINILPPLVADMIAAGEVVERPASVIKELMENSIDAGAKNIIVEIKGGGAIYIRVTDDGCGMAPEDAGVAFLRHATSKLRDAQGLEAIGTMGFRGEALAAISAVSEIELTTRRRGSAEGVHMTLRAGDIQDMTATGCPEGTTMIVRSLFFNTPARHKFLKSDRSEAAACVQTALRCALGHPEISVRFLRDGAEEFFSPGDSRLDSCIYTLLGRDIAKDMLPCESEGENMRVSGFVSSPSAGRGNRSAQYFYCNGRYIRSALLQSAVEQAYKNTLLTGRFPACVINLSMSFASVDVNVHPAKTEVKFTNERAVFDLVYHAARGALENEERVSSPSVKPEPKTDFYRSMSAKEFRESALSRPSAPVKGGVPGFSSPREAHPAKLSFAPQKSAASPVFTQNTPSGNILREPETPYQTRFDFSDMPKAPVFTPQSLDTTDFSPSEPQKAVENSVQNVENRPELPYKILGEALKTYIIVEQNDELIFIDKHAAHERMIFDALKAQKREIMAQTLLAPVPLHLPADEAEIIEENAALLSELGFEIEPAGETDYMIRAVPADMDAHDAAAAVEEICEKLSRGSEVKAESARDGILHTVACKAAIKAGWNTSHEELSRVAEEVLSGRVKYCPHGRPVSVTLSRRELDKMFKRIV